MSRKNFRGAQGKSLWENRNFSKGMIYTDEPLKAGAVKSLSNFDVNKTGGSLEPRDPFYNAGFKFKENSTPSSIGNDSILFRSRQDNTKEHVLNIGGKRYDKPYELLLDASHPDPASVFSSIEFSDGDSFTVDGVEYRLLAVDAVDYSDNQTNAEEAKNLLMDMIHESYVQGGRNVYAVYDKANDTDVDSYDRHLVWLFDDNISNPLNLRLLFADTTHDYFRIMGGFDSTLETIHVPEYLGHSEFTLPSDYDLDVAQGQYAGGKNVVFSPVQSNINIYSKDAEEELSAFKQTPDHIAMPMIGYDSFPDNLNLSQLYGDLDIPHGEHISITLNNIYETSDKQTHSLETNYRPFTRVPDIDGVVMLVTVTTPNLGEVYKGIMSLRYYIPIENNRPNYDKARFKAETYRNNAFKVRIEDLANKYSMNLLDPEIPSRRDFIGNDEVYDNRYYSAKIPSTGIINSDGNFVETMADDKTYTLRPYYVLPDIDSNESANSYAVRWDFYLNHEYFVDKPKISFFEYSDFPETGVENVIYIASQPNGDYYRWDGTQYVKFELPNPIQTSGWQVAFDRNGNRIDAVSNIYKKGFIFDDGTMFLGEESTTNEHKDDTVLAPDDFSYENITDMGADPSYDPLAPEYADYQDHPGPGDDYKEVSSGYKSISNTEKVRVTITVPHSSTEINTPTYNYLVTSPGRTSERFHEPRIKFSEGQDGPTQTQLLKNLATSDFTTSTNGDYDYIEFTVDTGSLTQLGEIRYIGVEELLIDKNVPGIHMKIESYWDSTSLEGPSLYSDFELSGIVRDYDTHSFETSDKFVRDLIEQSHGMLYAVISLAPATVGGDGKIVESDLDLRSEASINSIVAPIREQEEREGTYEHGQDLQSCRGITSFNGRVVLYDSPKAPNVLYMSEAGGNISYFPFNRAQDQFNSDIVHVEPTKDGLVVFTTTDIYLLYPEVLERETQEGETIEKTIHRARVVYNNLTIKRYNRNTVRTIGRDVLFMANDSILRLRPNPYVEDRTDLFLQNISKPVNGILSNPVPFITRRLMHYGVAGDVFSSAWKPEIEYYSIVKDEEVWILASVKIPSYRPFMIAFIHNLDTGTWKTYDTQAASFPSDHMVFRSVRGIQILMRNHNTIENGTTMMFMDPLNLWQFDEGIGQLFDTRPVKVSSDQFVYNTVVIEKDESGHITNIPEIEDIKMPIHTGLDTGFMNMNVHFNKRFHKAHIELQNISAYTVPLAMEFNIDGRVRQTSNAVRMDQITDINDPNYGKVYEEYQFEPFIISANEQVEGGTSFRDWQLGLSKFSPLNRLKIEFGVSGRGRSPGIEFGISTSGKFRFYGYGMVYKEQSGT